MQNSESAAVEGPTLAGRLSLREQVHASLRAALISGNLAPGVTYSVPALAGRFGVSATPVREAMLDLVNEGLLVPVPNKGFRVVEISDTELDEVTHIRQMLEVPAVGSLVGKIGKKDIARLRAMAKEIQESVRRDDLISYVESDRQFHLEMIRLMGNEQLVVLVDQLRARARLYGLGRLAAEGQLERSAAEHVEIVDALDQGLSRKSVEALLRHHISHVRGIWAS